MNEKNTFDFRSKAVDLSLSEKLDALPATPGVYQFKDADGKIIYVGKAQNLRTRVRQYFHRSRPTDPRIDAMIEKIADVELTVTNTEVEALILEANLIKRHKPRYNVVLKDDKSYPFIVITQEAFPRVLVTRRRNIVGKYFGPYTDVKSMRFALKTIRDIFMIRSCNYDLTEETITNHKYKVCLDYHIKKCEGPCEGFVSKERYNSMINQVLQILRGRSRSVLETLQREMNVLAENMHYEEAALIRNRIQALQVYSEKQKIVDSKETERDIFAVISKDDDACSVIFKIRDGKMIGSQHIYLENIQGKTVEELIESVLERYYLDQEDIPLEVMLSDEITNASIIQEWLAKKSGHTVTIEAPKSGDKTKLISLVKTNAQFWLDELEVARLKRSDFIPNSLRSLQRDLRLSVVPRRIECFDVSNLQGTDTVASLVVFVDAKPKRGEYRKYRIHSVSGPDDFASMQEVVERRYARILEENKVLPDLIIIDGGKGQLSSAVEVLNKLSINKIPILGLAKRLEEIFLPTQSESLLLPRTSSALRLLQRIRDEAHRFAITYHRTVRAKRILHSELDLIKGIGKKRATALLDAFGSVQGVRFATEDQLAEIVGDTIANYIKEYFLEEKNNI